MSVVKKIQEYTRTKHHPRKTRVVKKLQAIPGGIHDKKTEQGRQRRKLDALRIKSHRQSRKEQGLTTKGIKAFTTFDKA